MILTIVPDISLTSVCHAKCKSFFGSRFAPEISVMFFCHCMLATASCPFPGYCGIWFNYDCWRAEPNGFPSIIYTHFYSHVFTLSFVFEFIKILDVRKPVVDRYFITISNLSCFSCRLHWLKTASRQSNYE